MNTLNKSIFLSAAVLLLAGCGDKNIDERPVKPGQEDDKYIYTKLLLSAKTF